MGLCFFESTPMADTNANDKPSEEPLDTYELAQEEQAPSAEPAAINPSYAGEAQDDQTPASQPTTVPKVWGHPEEPKAVDPAQAAARREEERIRAATQLDQDDRRKRKITRIVMLALIGLALIVWFVGRWL